MMLRLLTSGRSCFVGLTLAAVLLLPGCADRNTVSAKLEFGRADLEFQERQAMVAVTMPGYGENWKTGAPMLPVSACHLVIPPGAVFEDIVIRRCESEVVAGEFDILPVQATEPVSSSGSPKVTPPDPRYYGIPLYPENVVWFARQSVMSGYNIVSVFVAPLQYEAAEKRLVFHPLVEFSVRFEQGHAGSSAPSGGDTQEKEQVEEGLARIVSNPEDLGRFAPGSGD